MNHWQPAIVALRATYLPAYKAADIYVPIRHHLYKCRENSTNQPLFMQNKPNFRKAKMNINLYSTRAYKNETAFRVRKNKPKTKPIQAKTNPKQTQFKPNSNPIQAKTKPKQTQFKPKQSRNKPNSNPIPLPTPIFSPISPSPIPSFSPLSLQFAQYNSHSFVR